MLEGYSSKHWKGWGHRQSRNVIEADFWELVARSWSIREVN